MSTQIEQHYIVHLEVRATATDPKNAVHAALETVQSGALGNVAWSVEPVEGDESSPMVPAPHLGSDDVDGPVGRAPAQPHGVETYRGEFLG